MLTIIENDQIAFHHHGYLQGIFRGGEPFYPFIGENVVEISVDLSWSSKLKFNVELPSKGLILWQLQLGLENVLMDLTDEGQFLAQVKAIQEFTRQLYEPLKERTFAFSLYRGPLDFSKIKRAPEEKFARRDYILDYLKLLSAYLPENPPLFLMLDGPMIEEGEFLALTSRDHYSPFQLIIRHPLLQKMPYSFDALGWGFSTVMGSAYGEKIELASKRLKYAFLLPHSSCPLSIWQEFTSHMRLAKELEARLIPEVLLTEMWEGIDELYVLEAGVTLQGRRKLAGFEAAGGIINYLISKDV